MQLSEFLLRENTVEAQKMMQVLATNTASSTFYDWCGKYAVLPEAGKFVDTDTHLDKLTALANQLRIKLRIYATMPGNRNYTTGFQEIGSNTGTCVEIVNWGNVHFVAPTVDISMLPDVSKEEHSRVVTAARGNPTAVARGNPTAVAALAQARAREDDFELVLALSQIEF
jgi:hypothetical protein